MMMMMMMMMDSQRTMSWECRDSMVRGHIIITDVYLRGKSSLRNSRPHTESH
jgi:hypothetical protein